MALELCLKLYHAVSYLRATNSSNSGGQQQPIHESPGSALHAVFAVKFARSTHVGLTVHTVTSVAVCSIVEDFSEEV
jgi:hypothetical protein